jgi:DNA repair exonuclease SbcCD ATPase subunit
MAQWVDPYFSVQVNECFEELLLFGKVELGKEKTNEELENKFQEQIQTLQSQLTQKDEQLTQKDEELTQEKSEKTIIITKYNKLEKNHNTMKLKQNYYKFGIKGKGGYICDNGLEYKDGLIEDKLGIFGYPQRKKCPNCECIECSKKEETVSLDKRLKNHRTLWPRARLKFVYYSKYADLIEKCQKVI